MLFENRNEISEQGVRRVAGVAKEAVVVEFLVEVAAPRIISIVSIVYLPDFR